MAQQPPAGQEPEKVAPQADSRPRSSPQTDPTNPHHQEAVGEWVANEAASERKVGEPGLTDRDREERHPTY